MRSLVAGCELRPCGGEHERCGEAPGCARREERMHTTHRAMARAGAVDRERSRARGAKRRIPPSRGDQACMMPAASAAARKTTLVTRDTTGQVCAEAGVAVAEGTTGAASAVAAQSGLRLDGLSGTSTG
eukprot:2738041-Pleurochrysis_carterae.AAC.1